MSILENALIKVNSAQYAQKCICLSEPCNINIVNIHNRLGLTHKLDVVCALTVILRQYDCSALCFLEAISVRR